MYRRLILALLLSGVTSYAAVVQERNETNGLEALKGTSPSSIPYNTYIPSMKPDVRMLIDRTDLSVGANKRLYAGYGLYDVSDGQCRYLSEGYFDETQLLLDFKERTTFDKHTYYVSRTPMPYTACADAAEQWHAHPLVVNTTSEKTTILNATYPDVDVWLGVYKDNCGDPLRSTDKEPVIYENWANDEELCNENELNVIAIAAATKQWRKKPSDYQAMCVLEFESPDPARPTKTCAPWWRVERDYVDKDYNASSMLGNGLVTLSKWDRPKKISYCHEFDSSYVPPDENATIPHTCVTYQSINGGSTCADDINQPQCFVDECAGYVRNTCRLVSDVVPYKDYEKGIYVDQAGVEHQVKVKDKKHIYNFECPPSRGMGAECVDLKRYTIFPQECPGGKKRFCGVDIPPNLNADGTVAEFKGMCPDGVTEILCPANYQSGHQRVCQEYETITKEDVRYEKCHAERDYRDYSFTTALGEPDIYEFNSTCIRTNNVGDARPHGEALVEVELKGFSNLDIILGTFGDNQESVFKVENSSYVTDYATQIRAVSFMPSNPVTIQTDQTVCTELSSTGTNGMDIKTLAWQSVDLRGSRFNKLLFGQDAFYSDNGVQSADVCKEDAAALNGEMLRTSASTLDKERISSLLSVNSNDLPGADVIAMSVCPSGYFNSFEGQCSPNNPCTPDGKTFNEWIDTGLGIYTAQCADASSGTYTMTTTTCASSSITGSAADLTGCTIPAVACEPGYIDNGSGGCVIDTARCVIKVPFADVGVAQIGPGIRFELDQQYDRKDCVEKALCVSFSVENFTSFSAPPLKNTCNIKKGTEGYTALIDGSGMPYDYEIYTAPTPPAIEPEEITPVFAEKNIEIDGAREILGVEFYTPGTFGYYTSFYTQPYQTDKVRINSVALGSQLEWPFVTERLRYQLTGNEHIWRTKQADYLPMDMYGGQAFGLIQSGVGAPVLIGGLIWNQDIEIFQTDYSWRLEKDLPAKYVASSYGYDFRSLNSRGSLTYMELEGFTTGKVNDDKGAINSILGSLYGLKYKTMAEMGIDPDDLQQIKTPYEFAIQGSVDECDWWEYSCEKDNGGHDFVVPETYLSKKTTTYFTGATNRFVAVVPMMGSYKIRAIDASGSVVAVRVISAQDFQELESGIYYSQVQFGTDMELSPNVEEAKSCVTNPLVEWGGGISGIYFEEQMMDGVNLDCAKSDDDFVRGASVPKIQILDMSANKSIEFELSGPIPYPNQIYILSLGEEERRDYTCYGNFKACTEEDYDAIN